MSKICGALDYIEAYANAHNTVEVVITTEGFNACTAMSLTPDGARKLAEQLRAAADEAEEADDD